jgi:phosphorylase/glycogen(starch) synthase
VATKNVFLFETSWEVCNKVGGIYTVLRTKLKEAAKNFGENYILIGPWLQENKHFIESTSPFLDKIAQALNKKNIACRIGYWDTEGKPIVILINLHHPYKVEELLYRLLSKFVVDSLASNFD